MNNKKILNVFSLVMINVIAIDNLRSLTIGAEYGIGLVFFYLLAALLFFIPTILITAELASTWPDAGGVYVWVRLAFGERWGFFTIWMQWIYNVVWYPTIFIFVAGILANLIHPSWANNPTYMLSATLIAFWSITLLNFYGLKISNIVSTIGALLGTIFPMVLIAVLGFLWMYQGNASQVPISWSAFFPNMTDMNNLAFLTNILFGLMGIEMSAVHAGDVKQPARDYPRALIYSALIILATFIGASLAIAIVVPKDSLNLVSGLMDAFAIFFKSYHLNWFIPIIACLIIIGSVSGASAWIVGPARGLLIACREIRSPKIFIQCNQKNMPIGILLIQSVIVTLLCLVFFFSHIVANSYWLLSNLTAQLALVFYIMLFAAAIRLRYSHKEIKRVYRIPGGKMGIWFVGSLGLMTSLGAIFLGFLPPSQMAIHHILSYEMFLIFGILIACIMPFIFCRKTIFLKKTCLVEVN